MNDVKLCESFSDMNGQDEGAEGLLTGRRRQPEDRFNIVYFIIVLQGIGTLLPWNFFITADAYFSKKLKDTDYHDDFENFFALAAFAPNIVAYLLNTMFKHKVPLKIRILIPQIVMTGMFIITVSLVKIDTDNWKEGFFAITLLTVALVNAFCAIYLGGLFGLCGMMPQRYTQALMTGQGIGGIFPCVVDISFKIGTSDPLKSAFWYFLTAVIIQMICIVSYLALYRINFSQYFLEEHIVFSNGDLTASIQCDDDFNNVRQSNGMLPEYSVRQQRSMPPFALIMKKIWVMSLSVVLVFLVTLSTFPAVISDIKSVHQGNGSEWTGKYFTPIVCFLLFNVGDFTGRVVAGFIQMPGQNGYWMLGCCVLRFIFIPLFAFCNYKPRRTKRTLFFKEDYWPIVFNLFFSVSNGYLGSLCMMYGPNMVEKKYAETAGTMMGYSLTIGLALGSALSFGITKSI